MSESSWRMAVLSVSLIALQLSSSSVVTDKSNDTTTSELNCSETLCASIVTKCLLTEHCKCNFANGNYTCHKECFSCLAELCYDCCSCFGMCPKTTTSYPLNKISSIEQIDEPIPQLFELYNSEDGDEQQPARYTSYSFLQEKTLTETQVIVRQNCTVAYSTQCLASDECKNMCQSMGSSFSRWFHNGCCECVGQACLDYGNAEARCLNCPDPSILERRSLDDLDDFYYGEHDNHVDGDDFRDIGISIANITRFWTV